MLKVNPDIYGPVRTPSFQQRAAFREAMLAGDIEKFPAVRASRDGFIYDGLAIYEAAVSLGLESDVVVCYHDKDRGELPMGEWVSLHVQANAKHGRALSEIERRRAVFVMSQGGISKAWIARMLGVREERVESLLGGRVIVRKATPDFKPKGLQGLFPWEDRLPAKPGVPPAAVVTDVEYAVMDKRDRGVPIEAILDQAARWFANPTLTPLTPPLEKAIRKMVAAGRARPDLRHLF